MAEQCRLCFRWYATNASGNLRAHYCIPVAVPRERDERIVTLRTGGYIRAAFSNGAGFAALSGTDERRLYEAIMNAMDAYEAVAKVREAQGADRASLDADGEIKEQNRDLAPHQEQDTP